MARTYFKSVAERPGNVETQKMRMEFLSTCPKVKIAIPEKVNSFISICGRFIVKLCSFVSKIFLFYGVKSSVELPH